MAFKISNETKVGVLAVLAIALLIIGFSFLKGKNLFARDQRFYAKYANVVGLAKSNPVIMHGVTIGQVDDVKLLEEGKNNVLVSFHVHDEIVVNKNFIAKIMSSDFLGSKAIELIEPGGKSYVKDNKFASRSGLAESGDTLFGTVETSLTDNISQVVAPVKEKVEKLLSSIDTVVNGLDEVFNKNTRNSLKNTFLGISKTIDHITKTASSIDNFVGSETNDLKSIIKSFDEVTKKLNANTSTITHAIDNIDNITDSIRKSNLKNTLEELGHTVKDVNLIITNFKAGKSPDGTALSEIQVYKNLTKSSEDLDKLIKDLQENPDRYLNFSLINFGGKKSGK